MPALSPTMQEGTLAKWHVKVGDAVKSGDVIAEIETDKATMEVEAVDEGVVDAILIPEGTEEVKVNTPIARLRGEGEAAGPTPPASHICPRSRHERRLAHSPRLGGLRVRRHPHARPLSDHGRGRTRQMARQKG